MKQLETKNDDKNCDDIKQNEPGVQKQPITTSYE